MIFSENRTLPHQPVLYHESLKYLQPRSEGKYIDGTLGAGGHAEGILSASSPKGLLLGLDVDNQALDIAKKRLATFGNRCIVRQASYAEMIDQIKSLEWDCVDGVLLDLGLSSMQLDTAERGFSFIKEAPLDLRFNPNNGITAAELVDTLSEKEIANIIWDYSEDPRSRQIARLIVENRPISTTKELAGLVLKAYRGKRRKTHPATRTFQALRIAVNNELEVLEKGLENSIKAVCTGGRIAIITFHSLEDRIVKQFFKRESTDCICPTEQPFCTCSHQAALKMITKKALSPHRRKSPTTRVRAVRKCGWQRKFKII